MLANLMQQGLGAHDAAAALIRVGVGTFFAISGWNKLTRTDAHANLVATLTADHVPFMPFNQWWVPSVEMMAGSSVALGLFTLPAALLLIVVCAVATCVDGWKRIWEMWNPPNWASTLDDLLYLPEVLYIVALVAVILTGPGLYSVDALLWR